MKRPHAHTPEDRAAMADRLRWPALALVALPALVRALATYEPVPYWDADPMRFYSPVIGVTPAMGLLLDGAAGLGCVLAVAWAHLTGRAVRLWLCALFAIGAVGVIAHGLVPGGGNSEDLVLGSAWCAALAAGLAGIHLAQCPRVRSILVGAMLGLALMLAAKGVLQHLVEHPAIVQDFRETRHAFYGARGWTPDSPMAQAYERRLLQREATGWFGLANVFGTFVAAGAVGFAFLLGAAWRARTELGAATVWLVGLGLVGSLAGVWLCGAKGAYGTLAVGLAAGAMLLLLAGFPERARALARHAGWLGPVLIAGVLAAIVLRGLVGERIGELSILFRWFYIEASGRIWAGNPLLGVGPSGFKDAYLLAKPPISPEEVSSPHSVFFDWLATLGLAGLAWGGLLLALSWHAARGAVVRAAATPVSAEDDRRDRAFLILLLIVPVGIGALLEAEAATPDAALMRLLGLLGWFGAAWGVMRLLRCVEAPAALVGAGVGAAALGAIAHAQIEVTPVWPGSAGAFLLLVAALASFGAAGSALAPPRAQGGIRARATGIVAVLLVGTSLVLPAAGIGHVWRWDRAMHDAGGAVAPGVLLGMRTDAALRDGMPGEVFGDLVREAAALSGAAPAASIEALRDQIMVVTVDGARRAVPHLDRALGARPDHLPTRQALSRHLLSLASIAREANNTPAAREFEARAEALAREGTRIHADSAMAWGWLGTIRRTLAEWRDDPDLLDGAVEANRRARELDPHGLTFPVRLFELALASGDRGAARHWASEMLRLDANMRLDPVRGLTDAQARRARRVIAEGE